MYPMGRIELSRPNTPFHFSPPGQPLCPAVLTVPWAPQASGLSLSPCAPTLSGVFRLSLTRGPKLSDLSPPDPTNLCPIMVRIGRHVPPENSGNIALSRTSPWSISKALGKPSSFTHRSTGFLSLWSRAAITRDRHGQGPHELPSRALGRTPLPEPAWRLWGSRESTETRTRRNRALDQWSALLEWELRHAVAHAVGSFPGVVSVSGMPSQVVCFVPSTRWSIGFWDWGVGMPRWLSPVGAQLWGPARRRPAAVGEGRRRLGHWSDKGWPRLDDRILRQTMSLDLNPVVSGTYRFGLKIYLIRALHLNRTAQKEPYPFTRPLRN
jgi:hypothetical protein